MATTVRSFAKINLGLRIGPPRADGFHDLRTLYQTIGLHDELTVTAERAAETAITLESNDPRVPTDATNTVWKMVAGALDQMGVQARVHIVLNKLLPIQGGLGAGSANAASALIALERELGASLPGSQRLTLAESVGSDVPLFLLGGTVYGHNRGELVVPYPDLPTTPCVVAAPAVGSSTPLAFRAWDQHVAALTPEAAQGRLNELSRVYASAFTPAGQGGVQTGASGVSGALDVGLKETSANGHSESGDLAGNPLPALVRTGIENDFEEVVFQQHPSLRDIRRALSGAEDGIPGQNCALVALLSGSGSSLFGLYRTPADASAAHQRVIALGVQAFQTETLTREAYWRGLFL